MDTLYSSLSLADWLLKYGITMVGTMMLNRVGSPKEIKDGTNRDAFSIEICWEEKNKRNLTSYFVSSSKKKKKNIIVLATVEPILGVAIGDEKQKPAIMKLYDFTNGETGIIDQKMVFYSVTTKSRRWAIASLGYLLDTIHVNTCSVYAMSNGLDPKKQNSLISNFNLPNH